MGDPQTQTYVDSGHVENPTFSPALGHSMGATLATPTGITKHQNLQYFTQMDGYIWLYRPI